MSTVSRARLSAVSALSVAAFLLAVAGPVSAQTRGVSMVDDAFKPVTISVRVGDTVRWGNNGDSPHTVTSVVEGQFDSGIVSPGGAYSRKFTKAGTFRYVCILHSGMDGKVVVAAAPKPTPKPTAKPRATRTPAPAHGRPTTPPGTNGGSAPTPDQPETDVLPVVPTTDDPSAPTPLVIGLLGIGTLGIFLFGRRRVSAVRRMRR